MTCAHVVDMDTLLYDMGARVIDMGTPGIDTVAVMTHVNDMGGYPCP